MGAVAALVLVLAAVLMVAAAAIAAHRVRTAADLAALAGAGAQAGVVGDGVDPCGLAARAAVANGGELRACELGLDGSITVEVDLPVTLAWPGLPDVATARARAGPAR